MPQDEYLAFLKNNQYIWYSVEAIMKLFGWGRSSTMRCLSKLLHSGLIEKKKLRLCIRKRFVFKVFYSYKN